MAKARPWLLAALTAFLVIAGIVWALTGSLGLALLTGAGSVVAFALLFLIIGLVFLVALLPGILFHELGHYVAGRAVGFRFHTFVAGPFGWRVEGARTVRYRVRPIRLNGFVSMTPQGEDGLVRRYFVFILGGPVASLLWTFLVFVGWRWSGIPLVFDVPSGSGATTLFVALFAFYALLSTVILLPGTLLPFRVKRMGGIPTDMLWLILLARGGPLAERLVAVTNLFRLLLSGTPVRDLPADQIEAGTRLNDGTQEEMLAQGIRWAHAFERNPAVAEKAIRRHREIFERHQVGMLEPWRSSAKVLQAENAARVERSPEAARAWSEGIGENPPATLLTSIAVVRAGIACLEGDVERENFIDAAERAVVGAEKLGGFDWSMSQEWLAEMRRGWPEQEI